MVGDYLHSNGIPKLTPSPFREVYSQRNSVPERNFFPLEPNPYCWWEQRKKLFLWIAPSVFAFYWTHERARACPFPDTRDWADFVAEIDGLKFYTFEVEVGRSSKTFSMLKSAQHEICLAEKLQYHQFKIFFCSIELSMKFNLLILKSQQFALLSLSWK